MVPSLDETSLETLVVDVFLDRLHEELGDEVSVSPDCLWSNLSPND